MDSDRSWAYEIMTILGLRDKELRSALISLQIRKADELGWTKEAIASGMNVRQWLAATEAEYGSSRLR